MATILKVWRDGHGNLRVTTVYQVTRTVEFDVEENPDDDLPRR